MDLKAWMQLFSTPRPSGSPAERQVLNSVTTWLQEQRIPFRLQEFPLYPYFFICIGLWLILSRTALALCFWLRLGWPTLLVALFGLAGGLLDVAFNLPLVSWPGRRPGVNLLIEFGPPEAGQEIILSAHTDSKTELLDHHQRMFFVTRLRLGIVLTLALGLLGVLDVLLLRLASPWASLSFATGVLISALLLFLAWGLGGNMAFGWLRPPSQGAADNGAACVILLGLAERLHRNPGTLQRTRLTLALFGGEEVNLQGSRFYVRSRSWPRPMVALNLEIMGQNGEYVLWEQDGYSLRLERIPPALNRLVERSVCAITGQPPQRVGPVNSDGGQFLLAGLPATTLGTYHRQWRDRGLHSALDNLGRIEIPRLDEGIAILDHFIHHCDQIDLSKLEEA